MTTQELAALMGQKETDVQSFIACLRVWTDKGYSVEEAIAKHVAQMERLVNHAADLAHSSAGHELVVSAFFH